MKSAWRVLCFLFAIHSWEVMAAQGPQQTPAQWVAAQQAAMIPLAYMDGVWRGTGWMIDAPGETPRHMTMTYRIGPFLEGAVKVIEIRGYLADGSYGFHAFNMVSFDAQKGEYVMNARAAGRSGIFAFQLAGARKYTWQIGNPTTGLHYEGALENGEWIQIGRRIAPGAEPIIMSDYRLRRVADTDWPEAGAIGP
jgi:hypothetical protein